LVLFFTCVLFLVCRVHRHRHSFPTRRSSDLYVVQLLDVGWNAEPPYYVMEYVENGSLEDYLNEQHTLPVSEAVGLFREVTTGLLDRKSTRLNSSHVKISYAVFCLKKKKQRDW